MTTKREIVKKVAGAVVQFGTGFIINGIVKTNVPVSHPGLKIVVGLTSFAIGGVVADAAQKYMDTTIDELIDGINKFKAAA